MVRDLILGTAGHIDHGKTALVKTLTGVDCDRLPEEKARGITIDLGFASLALPGRRLGVVDVPGHERFIRNMLAGAAGIDLVLLVVAADDGVMPQTREHLEIVRLLGIRQGVVAITKSDLADAGRREEVAEEVRSLLADTTLAGIPLVFTSARSGEGIDELRGRIEEQCRLCEAIAGPGEPLPFRMSIDRAFTRPGHGTVVTGSVASGRLKVGDDVEWWPSGRIVRVRSLHNHDRSVDEVHQGQRAALNLAGVELADCARGQELAAPGYLVPSRSISVRVRCSADSPRPLKHRLPVRLHIGTAEHMATLALLDQQVLLPGDSALGQLFLDTPAAVVWGQPFVLRDSAATTTLGGGSVLQPRARKIRPIDATARARLAALEADTEDRILAAAEFRGLAGFTAADAVREAGVAAPVQLLKEFEKSGKLIRLGDRLVSPAAVADLEERLLVTLGKLHAEHPEVAQHDRAKVLARLDYLGADPAVAAGLDRLIFRGLVNVSGVQVSRADYLPKLTAAHQRVLDTIVAACEATPFSPPSLGTYLNLVGGNAGTLREIAAVGVVSGRLVKVADDLFLHASAAKELRRRIDAALRGTPGGLTLANIRDLLGTSRKYAVPICEYLDRLHVTRRDGDLRFAVQDPALAGE
ncbi:MAG: selenocysteine-specific translation elongation factor [Gemmataceae bacterium]|nr:selenocysteine-specific translation elongation factor [Gemmataceae bacterium]